MSEKHPNLSVAVYGMAIGVATFQLLNSERWLSKVVAAAALGVFSAKLASALIGTKPSRFRQMIRQQKLIRSGATMNQSIPA